MGFLILAYTYKTYKNYEAINNKLLEEIRRQNMELQQLIQCELNVITITNFFSVIPHHLKEYTKEIVLSKKRQKSKK